MHGEEIVPKKESFMYLGSFQKCDGRIDKDIIQRIQWRKWRGEAGVLCNRKVPLNLKGKFYKTVVMPALMHKRGARH